MMKTSLNFLLIALLSLMFLTTSCTRTEEFGGGAGIGNSIPKIKAGITGRVTDHNNLPVKDALVSAYGKVVRTDINGEFVLRSMSMPKYYGYVKVEKAQFFPGSRTFNVTKENGLNRVEIQLLPKAPRGSFTSYLGGTVTFDGITLDFAPNTITREDGTAYTGAVVVMGAYLNPEDANFSRIMPGNLVGMGENGQLQGLESFGMMAVELEGAAGEKLQVMKGKTVDMGLTVAASKLPYAPQTLPLWYFNEETGRWQEEGEAVLENGVYKGKVGHFSYWNCDYGGPIVNLEAQFVDSNGNPVPNVQVKITASAINDSRSAWTDNTGSVSGGVPPNSTLVIQVLDNCGNIIYTQTAGPYTSSVNLGTITINSVNYVVANYTGTVTDCNNAPLVNGFVKLTVGPNVSYHNLINGAFNITVPACLAGAPV
ncbi:MAG: hypothetical protein ACRCSB_06360, partial [Bacteroidales bacterium]